MTDHLDGARSMIGRLGLHVSPASEHCSGCGATVPAVPDGPVHRSIGASPGCWGIYTALLAGELTAFDARMHQLSVDTYAAQHPGSPSPQPIQSVCAHLVALCLSLEHGFEVEDLRPLTGDLSNGRWSVTIIDLLDAELSEDYGDHVRGWAASTWAEWSAHHAQARAWAAAGSRSGR
jgi:hypothetical protein